MADDPLNITPDYTGGYGRTATAQRSPFKGIVVHVTGRPDLQSELDYMRHPDQNRGGNYFGYHFLVDRDGSVYQTAPFDARTNHIMPNSQFGLSNNNSIGVAFVGADKGTTPEQIAAGKELTNELATQFKIPSNMVLGHGELDAATRGANKGLNPQGGYEGQDFLSAYRGGQGGGSSGGGGASATTEQPATASTPFSLSAPSSRIPSAGEFQPLIDAAAKKYNLDPNFFDRVLYQENRFQPEGTSKSGAQGFAQFMPGTAARYGVDVHDPASSIEGAAHYLSDLSARYNGNLGLAAAGYNWGEGHVDQWLQGKASPPAETTNYVNTITGHSMDDWRADPRLPVGSGGPGRSPSGASGTAAGAPAATPGPLAQGQPPLGSAGNLPGFTPDSPGAKMTAAGLKSLGLDAGKGQDQGQDDKPLDIQPSPMLGGPPMPVGGPMMISPGGMGGGMGRSIAEQQLANQGFGLQPNMADALGNPTRLPQLAAQSPGAGPPPGSAAMPGAATGAIGIPGTTLNSPSALQTALLYGSLDPFDPYGRFNNASANPIAGSA